MSKSKQTALPLVAIVGRPNVGKSTLFNRLIGERRSIVGDEPGITRDRIYGESSWNGKHFALVDTGGIVPDDDALIPANILKQAGVAISEAQALVWMVDARKGVTPLDEELARLLRGTGKRVIVAANKADAVNWESDAGEFHEFGFADVVPISAEHGNGLGEMLNAIVAGLRGPTVKDLSEPPAVAGGQTEVSREDAIAQRYAKRDLNLAIVGRPNVGKSSLLNRLLGEERAIVSPIAGTTRDAVDTLLQTDEQTYRLIDTAGIRRKGKTREMAEKLSVIMARKSLERADVAIIVLDAEEGIAQLDAAIAGYAVESGCSIILAVNKWDALEGKLTGTAAAFERKLRDQMKFLSWAPVVTTSALTGQRVNKLLSVAVRANQARNTRVATSRLNDFFEREVKERSGITPAKTHGGARLHVQYITQIGIRPPQFVVFTSGGKAGLHFSFLRHLENRLREEFDFFATPIRIVERHKSKRRKR
ncbi:MAG TPA: ribosome biogenesis GTPase Der [Pyrinomonadaceae bacterium]|jgi:GTP-binding protein|nr:ribosome biogenesis GTPase Der [Pyrinomonadaceae bacterium]